jgi:hypothetical protein
MQRQLMINFFIHVQHYLNENSQVTLMPLYRSSFRAIFCMQHPTITSSAPLLQEAGDRKLARPLDGHLGVC